MTHVLLVTHGHPSNFLKFENFVNNFLNYGSKPYLREVKIYDVAIKKENLEPFLSDIRKYFLEKTYGGTSLSKVFNYFKKLAGIDPIDMKNIEWSGKEIPDIKGGFYLYPLGCIKDYINHLGGEEI